MERRVCLLLVSQEVVEKPRKVAEREAESKYYYIKKINNFIF
jgi:hypothetical protein